MQIRIHYKGQTRLYDVRAIDAGTWTPGNWPEDVWHGFTAPSRKLLDQHYLDAETLDAFDEAMDECRAAGIAPIIYSEYAAGRTFAQQEELRIANPRFAGAVGARGGHQSGRALDLHFAYISAGYYGANDDRAREIGTAILARHGLVRPYRHEPWHYEMRSG
jgi:D-alanyl-D-alanine dipeptidase